MNNKHELVGRFDQCHKSQLLTLLLQVVLIGAFALGSIVVSGCDTEPDDDDQGTDFIDDDNNNDDNDNDNDNDDTSDDDSDDDDDDTTGWPREIVDVSGDGITGIAIAAPSNTDIVIVYANGLEELRMVRGRPGNWAKELIRADSVGIVSSAMSIDDNADVHVVFVDNVAQELIYGNNSAGTWAFETVDGGLCDIDGACPRTSIAVGSAGYVYVAYYIGELPSAEDLMFGERTEEGWQVLLVPPSTGEDPQRPHILVDQISRVVIQYIFNPPADAKEVKYVERNGDTWTKHAVYEFIDETSSQTAWPAFDSQGVLNMLVSEEVYEPAWEQDLYHVSEASSWYPQYLYNDAFDPRLVAGANEELHGCYLGWPSGLFNISYLHFRDGEWTREEVDPNVVPTETAMIAADPDGFAHIAYADGEEGTRLVYATNRPTE